MVLKSPSFVLDGCEWSCGTNLLYLAGITPAVRFLLPEYAEAQGFDLAGGSRRFPAGVTPGVRPSRRRAGGRHRRRHDGSRLCVPASTGPN